MSNFLDSELSSPGQNSTDPVMAAINGEESLDGFRFGSSTEFSAETEDIDIEGAMPTVGEDLLLVPQNAPGVLSVGKDGDEVSRKSSEVGKDPLTGETDDAVAGEMDTLTGGNTDEVEIETRARKRDKAGNNMKKARNLGVLTGDEKLKEFVGKSDGKDFYKFRVKKKTDVDIDLRGLSGNADLYLLNNRGKIIEKSAKGGKRAEDIERTLNPGSYYVRVQPRNRRVNANYNLSLAIESPDVAGNSRNRSHNLGVLKDDEKFQEFVGRSDRKDFYKFRVKEKTNVDIDLRGLSGNADLYLLNNKGKVIEKSAKGGKRAEDIERTLNPGSYYVRVQPKGKANANYNLSLETTSVKGSKLEYAPNEVLVKLKSEPTVTQTQSMMSSYGALAVQNLVRLDPNINSPIERWQVFKLEPGSDIEKMQKRLEKDSRVELVEFNYKVSMNSVPNDPDFGRLWGLNNTGSNRGKNDADIDAPEAWNTQKGSKDVVVAVLDTGVDYNHPDLAGNIWKNAGEISGNFVDDDRNGYIDDVYGFDWINEDANPIDDHNHGTHVAGTIGAIGSNNRGIVGVNHNVSIMSLKFIHADDYGFNDDAAKAIAYATDMGANIINASYGLPYSEMHKDAIEYANDKNVLFVAAAGNDIGANNDAIPVYPANYNLPNVISVAATDNQDKLANFSNYGRNTVDIGAPGVGILSTVPGNKYASYNGTSMATPHVAGAAALVLAENPNLSVTALKNTLLNNADSIASLRGKTVTGGRLNVNKAIEAVSQPKKPDDFITVNSPNGGNTLEPGKSHTINWSDNIGENVKLELYKGGSLSSTISSSTSSDGSYSWTVPTSIASSSDYKVKITSVSDSSVSDFSNSNFTIKADEPDDVITVNSPNGGNTLEPGNSYTLTWNDNISENVKLELYKGNSFNRTISSSTQSDGSYSWTVPASIASGSDYKVKITSVSDSSVSDFSNSNFTIEADEPDGFITVKSPNGGNDLEPGKNYTISWNDNISENVKLELYKGGSFNRTITSSTFSDGSYTWSIPTSITDGGDYKVKITSVSNGSVSDFSNSNFTIAPIVNNSSLTLEITESSDPDINAITGTQKWNLDYLGNQITYGFVLADGDGYYDQDVLSAHGGSGLAYELTDDQKNIVRKVFSDLEEIIPVDFVETSYSYNNPPIMVFTGVDADISFAVAPDSFSDLGGDVFISNDFFVGTINYSVLRKIGIALGFYGIYGKASLDTTVMGAGVGSSGKYPTEYGPLDIKALQYLYGS